MLVSAAEVVAVQWRGGQDDADKESLLRELKPTWADRLEKDGGPDLVRDMAKEWSHLLGATTRFIKFVMEHLPDPPEKRPPHHRIDWSKKSMRAMLQYVYDRRSDALHGGIPFPPPMCSPPMTLANDWEAPTERPFGEVQADWGATYLLKDLPMHMHMFAHIVRGAILKWWDLAQRA
jgi:hypothetical protein